MSERTDTPSAPSSPEPPDSEARASMEAMKDIMDRFRAGELDRAELPLPSGDTMLLSRDDRAPGAFLIESPNGEGAMLSVPFDATADRPESYPVDLPFLPGTSAALTEVEGQSIRTMTWFISGDPAGWYGELRLQMVSDGWEEQEESNTTTVSCSVTAVNFEKGGVQRTVMANRFGGHSQLKLLEQRK